MFPADSDAVTILAKAGQIPAMETLSFASIRKTILLRTLATFLALIWLLGGSTFFIRLSLDAQKRTLEVASITYEQRILLQQLSQRILFLLNSANQQTPDRILLKVQQDIADSLEQLNRNHAQLEQMHSDSEQWLQFWPLSAFRDQRQIDLLRQVTHSFSLLNERAGLFASVNIDAIRTGFNFWDPQDLAIVSKGEYTLQLAALNEQIYQAALKQNHTLSVLHNYLFVGVLLGIFLIWQFILRPMVRQLKAQFSQLQKSHATLEYQASHDALTGLLSRTYFNQHVRGLQAKGNPSRIGVIAFDLDGFKVINDGYGHAVGDVVLQTVAARLLVSRTPSETQYRLGGDEFLLLLADVQSEAALTERAGEIVRDCAEPMDVLGRSLKVAASVGVVYQKEANNSWLELCSAADIALYHVKDKGGGGFALYRDTSAQKISQALQLEQDLHQAILQDGFRVYYQPIVRLKDHKVVSMEALMRWQHPALGLLCPQEWLPAAKRLGLLSAISTLAVEQVTSHLLQLGQRGISTVPVSINATRSLLTTGKMLDAVLAADAQPTLEGDMPISIEVPESIVLDQNLVAILEQLERIRERGIKVALDDFGTGYATLSHLLTLPFDTLKLDQRFVRNMAASKASRLIVKTMLELANGLGKQLICEGVEDRQTRDLLFQMGCEYVQGYYYHSPLPFEKMANLLVGLTCPEESSCLK